MDKLPLEILNEVFILLHQLQKVECMKVCRHWEKIISDSCLFHTLLIINKNNFRKAKKKLEQMPSFCLQVERLVICIRSVDGDFLSTFPLRFPNLKSYYRLPRISNPKESISDNVNQKWSSQIREFCDSFSPKLYHHVLGSNKYDPLRTLSIRNLNPPDSSWTKNPLKNAPNLTKLTLSHSSLKVEHLEHIHNHLPLLQSINLIYCTFDFSNPPRETKPALRVTHVRFDLLNPNHDLLFGLQQYIHKKYINVVELSIEIASFFYKYMLAGDMTEMDIRIGSTQKMLTSLLYRFGPQLVKLDISFEEFDPHLLENIGGAAYKLEHFKLMSSRFNHAKMETLLKFGLFQHLRSLHLVSILNDSLICLKGLANLKELTLDGPKFNHIKLNDVLDLCCGLECLHFIRCQLTLQSTSNVYSLKTLKFSNTRLPKDIDNFISMSCCQLKCLRFMNCKYEKTSLCLEDLHLTRLEVMDMGADYRDYYILVFTKDDDQRRWWKLGPSSDIYTSNITFDPYDDPVYPLPLPLAYNSLTCQPYLTLTFGSVRHIYTCLI